MVSRRPPRRRVVTSRGDVSWEGGRGRPYYSSVASAMGGLGGCLPGGSRWTSLQERVGGCCCIVRWGWCCLAERGSKVHGSRYLPRISNPQGTGGLAAVFAGPSTLLWFCEWLRRDGKLRHWARGGLNPHTSFESGHLRSGNRDDDSSIKISARIESTAKQESAPATSCCLPKRVLAWLRLLSLIVFQTFFGLFLTFTTNWHWHQHIESVTTFVVAFILHLGFCMCTDGWCTGRPNRQPSAATPAVERNYGSLGESEGQNPEGRAGEDIGFGSQECNTTSCSPRTVVVVEGTPLDDTGCTAVAKNESGPCSRRRARSTECRGGVCGGGVRGCLGQTCFVLQYVVSIVAILGLLFLWLLSSLHPAPKSLVWGFWLGESLGILAIIWWAPFHLFAMRYSEEEEDGEDCGESCDHVLDHDGGKDVEQIESEATMQNSPSKKVSEEAKSKNRFLKKTLRDNRVSYPWLWALLCVAPTLYVWSLPLLAVNNKFAVDAKEPIGYSVSMYTSNPHATGALGGAFLFPSVFLWLADSDLIESVGTVERRREDAARKLILPARNFTSSFRCLLLLLLQCAFGGFVSFGVTYAPKINLICALVSMMAMLTHHMRVLWVGRRRIGMGRNAGKLANGLVYGVLLAADVAVATILVFRGLHWHDAGYAFGHWYWGAECVAITAGIWFVPVMLGTQR